MKYEAPHIEGTDNPALRAALLRRIDQKTKPLGALGRLEALALQIGLIQGTNSPELSKPQILVCAADHGLTAAGVSAYPSEVTAQMVANMLAGGAAVNVFAERMGFAMTLANAGVAAPMDAKPRTAVSWINEPIAPGTRNALLNAAMSAAEATTALQRGEALGRTLPGNVLALGEMGIGNTASAALLLCALCGVAVEDAVGRGTGLNDAQLAHKTGVLKQVLAKHKSTLESADAFEALCAVGGLEIAMMAGAMLGAAAARKVVLIDGFIACSAALVACRMRPEASDYSVFAHESAERGSKRLLQELSAQPLLALNLRLGEGSGALLAYPLLQAACDFLARMASFESAGVSAASPAP